MGGHGEPWGKPNYWLDQEQQPKTKGHGTRCGLQLAAIPVLYEGVWLDCGFRADLLVDGDLIVEIKSVERLQPIHTAQVLTHLKLTGARQALLMNFGQLTLMAGLRSYLGPGTQVPDSVQ